jgi:hypothetical protein
MKPLPLVLLVLIFSTGWLLADDLCSGTSCMPETVVEDCTVMDTNGCIDWNNGIIYATGMGVPNPNFPTQAQRTYSAYEAAKTVAMRNLLQMVEGITISSERTVKAGMLENDAINTQISGRLRQVIEAAKPRTMGDGSIWVTMKMYLRDVMSILVDNQQFIIQDRRPVEQKPATASEPQTTPPADEPRYGGKADIIYTGLIIDAGRTGIAPAMSPKVLDPDGREIYGSAAVERDFVLRHGVAGYVKELTAAISNERVKGNPLIIKAQASQKSSDLIISAEDAKLLRQLDASQTFLREARVVIVIGS